MRRILLSAAAAFGALMPASVAAYSVTYLPQGGYVFNVWRDIGDDGNGGMMHVLTTFTAATLTARHGVVTCAYYSGELPNLVWNAGQAPQILSPGSLQPAGEGFSYVYPAPPLGLFDPINRALRSMQNGVRRLYFVAWYPNSAPQKAAQIETWGVMRGCADGVNRLD